MNTLFCMARMFSAQQEVQEHFDRRESIGDFARYSCRSGTQRCDFE